MSEVGTKQATPLVYIANKAENHPSRLIGLSGLQSQHRRASHPKVEIQNCQTFCTEAECPAWHTYPRSRNDKCIWILRVATHRGNMTNPEDPFTQVNELISLLHELDERGLILSLAAFAEDTLGELISSFMRPVESAERLLNGFNAPLGTFSSRIHTAYALGLITKSQFSDLEHLCKIRNEFAHSWKPLSFEDKKIVPHIKGISFSGIDDKFPESGIEKVRSSLSFLLVELHVTTQQIHKNRRRVSQIGAKLDSGIPGNLEEQISICRTKFKEINTELAIASGERHDFFRVLQKRWVIKYFRVISHTPKAQQKELLMELSSYLEGGVEEMDAITDAYFLPKPETY